MKKTYHAKLNCVTYELMAGEYLATQEPDVVLTTLLGSCVAVCLIDDLSGVIGMNHFMLPGRFAHHHSAPVNDAKYGTCAIDLLVKDMVKAGARRNNLKAKVFGGGRIVEHFSMDIASSNTDFTKIYLENLAIPIIAEDLGGSWGRKLFFFSQTKEVLLKRIADFNGKGD